MEKYLTVGQVSKILNVSTETLRRWDNSGKFASSRHPINNYRVYPEGQVEMFIKEMQLSLDYEQSKAGIDFLEPLFTTSLGSLYKADAIEFLKSLDSNSVDLVFADPPYNIKKAEWDSFASQQEYVEWSMSWITEAHRILRPTGSLFICGFSEILADIKWSASHLFQGCKWLVWYYRNKANLGADWGRSHESILHFRKSRNFVFNIDEVRISYNEHTLKYPQRTQAQSSQYANGKKSSSSYIWRPNPLGAKPKDVFEIPTISNNAWEKYPHETQKPVELLKKIVLSSSHEGQFLLDPFGGSGTTYAVAEAFNRKWLGIEQNEAYCRIIEERLQDKQHIERIRLGKDEKDALIRRQNLRG